LASTHIGGVTRRAGPMPRLSGLLAPFPWGVYPRK
jgi:hypothetical protein